MDLGIIRIDHIGIATSDMEGRHLFEKLLDRSIYKSEIVHSESVNTDFLTCGSSKIELLHGLNEPNAISSFVSKRGPGIHHIAFEVLDIERAYEEASKAGLQLLHDRPKPGADNKMIFFIHPKSMGGVLVEICQTRSDES